MTLREVASLIPLTTGPAFAAIGWILSTDYRGFKTWNATRTVRGSSILFPGFRDGDDERIARQRRLLTSIGWAFMIAGGFQTLSGLYIAVIGLPR